MHSRKWAWQLDPRNTVLENLGDGLVGVDRPTKCTQGESYLVVRADTVVTGGHSSAGGEYKSNAEDGIEMFCNC